MAEGQSNGLNPVFGGFIRTVTTLVAAVLAALLFAGIYFGILAPCSGGPYWYTIHCDTSSNPLIWLAFLAALLVAVAVVWRGACLVWGSRQSGGVVGLLGASLRWLLSVGALLSLLIAAGGTYQWIIEDCEFLTCSTSDNWGVWTGFVLVVLAETLAAAWIIYLLLRPSKEIVLMAIGTAVRASPSDTAAAFAWVDKGATYLALRRKPGWVLIRSQSRQEGWVDAGAVHWIAQTSRVADAAAAGGHLEARRYQTDQVAPCPSCRQTTSGVTGECQWCDRLLGDDWSK